MTEKELHKVFSAHVKNHRKHHNWSQVQLAKKTGVSINFINDLESGKKWASPATMIKLAAVFKIEVYELLRPAGLFPDNVGSLIQQYTDTVHAALEQVRTDFLQTGEAARRKETKE